MSLVRVCCCYFIMSLSLLTTGWSQEVLPLENEVRQMLQNYQTAFNRQDLQAIEAMWAEAGSYVNQSTQESTAGRARIISDLKDYFVANANSHLSAQASEIKPLGQTACKVTGTAELVLEDGSIEYTQFLILLEKQQGNWVIESITESALPAANPHDELIRLNWLIGNWQDEVEGLEVTTTCNWSRGENFLIRSFTVKEGENTTEGSEVIGWDPQYRQIRSWMFLADGSFGTSFWTANGDQWVVKSVTTLVDGSVAESLRVISDISESSITVQLTSQSIDGQMQPAGEKVLVKRVPATAGGNE